jgi:hypothetical protein
MRNTQLFQSLFFAASFACTAQASPPTSQKSLDDAQAILNAEVLAQPFSFEQEKAVETYIEERLRLREEPLRTAPTAWRKHYDCHNLHNYNDYRDCRYFQRYYQAH